MLGRRDLARLDFCSETIHRQADIGCGEILAHAAWPVWHLDGANALSHSHVRWAYRDGVGSSSDGLLGLWVSLGCKIQRHVVYVNNIMLVTLAPDDACLGTTRVAARPPGSSGGLADGAGDCRDLSRRRRLAVAAPDLRWQPLWLRTTERRHDTGPVLRLRLTRSLPGPTTCLQTATWR